ncbi:hypothetical protein MRB53_025926 [Persea americana]|uniref:Uncharacterized protein n=1 Tax=Persea americana TaxID=3435 RepID=A0ACC2LGW2_PERAE|nr:hypothetical protein MRB53_025926 [Persea americana]
MEGLCSFLGSGDGTARDDNGRRQAARRDQKPDLSPLIFSGEDELAATGILRRNPISVPHSRLEPISALFYNEDDVQKSESIS